MSCQFDGGMFDVNQSDGIRLCVCLFAFFKSIYLFMIAAIDSDVRQILTKTILQEEVIKMCSIPKPPPPPPAPALSLSQDSSKTEDCNSNVYQPVINNPSDCVWAEEDPELRRACIVARICLEKRPYKLNLKPTKSVIQVGPTCGLAALSMLINEQVSPDTMLSIAKNSGYTNHGEMLSCINMGKLVSKVFAAADIDNINYSVKKGDLNSPETIENLLNGGMLLVPYDADVNHSPSLRNGHTAHWCVVSGIIIINKPESTPSIPFKNVYILCRHGKSKFLSAWSLKDLAKSNRNLWEFSPKKQSDNLDYVQPEGGLGGDNGLRSQFLMFNWS